MNYTTEKSLPEAVNKERKFTEFFRTVKATTRNIQIKSTSQKWNATDEQLSLALANCQTLVREALCDSFDTPRAVNELSNLVSTTNSYLQIPASEIKVPLVRQVSRYVF
jgi:cysteinyl-tRNA synthetase